MKMRLSNIILMMLLMACTDHNRPIPEKALSKGSQMEHSPKGKLCIIGGGKRPEAMVKSLVEMSLGEGDYALVFSQSSGDPDTSFFYINEQLQQYSQNAIIHVDSAAGTSIDLDSIVNAALIYITGGDQSRFMKAVDDDRREAIKKAYWRGATIAGTSAGAALMGKTMITGAQNLEPKYQSTYSWLSYGNGIYTDGIGLLDSAIVDMHFVARSRYNRVISAMADNNLPLGIGIEEATALIISPEFNTTIGEGQVVIFQAPERFTQYNDRIGFKNMNVNAYLQGDTFTLKPLK